MSDPDQMRLFEGEPVDLASYKITGPVDVPLLGLRRTEKVFLVIEAECEEITFGPADKKEPEHGVVRRHALKVNRAAAVDSFEAMRILEGLADALPPGDDR
jgi:hypothetical protein